MLTEFNGSIKNALWAENEKFVFLILADKKKPGRENLLIINTDEKNISRNITGSVYKDLLLHGNLLFFDAQFDGVSQITIYDFANNLVYDEIREHGGCGINDLFF